jgi:hypothetical protein
MPKELVFWFTQFPNTNSFRLVRSMMPVNVSTYPHGSFVIVRHL